MTAQGDDWIDVDHAEDVDTFFWRECEKRVFWLQYCRDCAKWQYYPRFICSHCASRHLVWRMPSGEGVLDSFTVIRRGAGGFAELAPYAVALVTLTEGPTMMSNVVGCDPEALAIGAALHLEFDVRNSRTVPVFRLTK